MCLVKTNRAVIIQVRQEWENMTETLKPINPQNVPPRAKRSIYPEPFATKIGLRDKRILGDLFGISNFGVNFTTLAPMAQSALKHAHTTQDEFIYIIEGNPTLYIGCEEFTLSAGEVFGFAKGGAAHHLVNNTDKTVTYLEIGDRAPNDICAYPDDDLKAQADENGKWQFTHKDGTPY